MKRGFLLLSLLFMVGCATTHSAVKLNASFSKYDKIYLINFKDDPRKVLPKVRQRLERLGFKVILTEEDEPIGGTQGTGFIITPDGYVLTAAHVIVKKEEATLWLNGKRYEADVVYIERNQTADEDSAEESGKKNTIQEAIDSSLNSEDNRSIEEELRENDLALLKIRLVDQAFTPLNFADDPQYTMGNDVYTIGFPLSNILGDKPRLNKGLISSSVGIKDNPRFVQMSVEIQAGNSGGPLLNEKGQVIGMVQMTLNPMNVLAKTGGMLPQNVNFAIKSALIKEFLDRSSHKASIVLRQGAKMPFGDVQNSIVQVRSGILPEGFRKQPKLACLLRYNSFWDVWHRFSLLDIIFYDVDTEEILLRAGQYGDNPFSNENSTLDQVFKEIKTKLGK